MPQRAISYAIILLAGTLLPGSAAAAGQDAPRQGDLERSREAAERAAEKLAAGDQLGALRAYQRAAFWARTPGQPPSEAFGDEPPAWLDQIVPLALEAERVDEAARYALLLPPPAVGDPAVFRRLALVARERRRWAESVKLQERWLAAGGASADRFEQLLVRLEIGRLHVLSDNPAAASRALEPVQRALVGGKLPGRVRSQLESSLGGSMATTWEVLGETHLAAGRRRLAAEAFSRLSQIPAAEARAAYWLARLALDERRPLLAYELVRRCLAEADPGAAATLQNRASKLLGDVYAQLNQPLAVVDDLRQIAEGRPED
ncbi:MAG: hypothetical protein AAF596_02695, partial [Planctomycetota bacterium]